jgi:hypothetical protein
MIAYEEDIEANRIWNDYQTFRKQKADIGVVFACLFGYLKASKYLKYFNEN